MDTKPKTGSDGLRGVKTKSHQRIGPKQQTKLRKTLEHWFKPSKKEQTTTAVCQTSEDTEMVDEGDLQSNPAQVQDCQNNDKALHSDTDEETQPLTPQDLDEEDSASPVTKAAHDDGEMETCTASSESSVKQSTRITDFFSGTSSSSGLPVKRGRPHKSTEKQDSDKGGTSAPVKPDVKWLGTPINELKRMPGCGKPLPPLRDVPGLHTVMIRV